LGRDRNFSKSQEYEENMKELPTPYMGRGTWKNSEFVPLGGGAKYEFRGRSRREKRHETC